MKKASSSQIQRALRKCAKAGFSKRRMEEARHLLEMAEGDCKRLDENDTPPGNFFLSNFYAGLNEPQAVSRIYGFLTISIDGRSKLALNKARKAGEAEAYAAHYIAHMRELVRDRWPVELALTSIPAEFIQERFKAGDAHFFEMLGKELEKMRRRPERYGRGIESWIVRAWMPLCLWRCDNAHDAWPLLRRAALANNMHDIVRQIGTPPSKSYVRAWSNARNR